MCDSIPALRVESDDRHGWWLHGQLYGADGPAEIHTDGVQEWWLNGQLHRAAGPAVIYSDGLQEWWLYGELHRTDGPARIYPDGNQEWWLNGDVITQRVHVWMQNLAVTWPWDAQTQTQFELTFS